MFVKTLAKTDMLMFWQFMFEFCKDDYSCVLGWLLAGILAFLAVVIGLRVMMTRLNKRREKQEASR